MQGLKRLVLHPYFPYVYLFTIVFCIVALLALPANHPFVAASIVLGIGAFLLQRYRKRLISEKSR